MWENTSARRQPIALKKNSISLGISLVLCDCAPRRKNLLAVCVPDLFCSGDFLVEDVWDGNGFSNSQRLEPYESISR